MADVLSFGVGGVIGVVGTVLGAVGKDWLEGRRARASAYGIAQAYVSGILTMQVDLQHVLLYRRWLRERLPRERLPRILGGNERSPDEVKTAIIGRLGSLSPEDARDMVLFFNKLENIDIGTREMADPKIVDDANLTEVVEKHVKIMDEMLELGRELVDRLGGGEAGETELPMNSAGASVNTLRFKFPPVS